MKHIVLCLACTVLAIPAIQSAYAQGSLTPPGPPGPTMITLSQVEPRTPITNLPYTITQPGSYYLTTNLTCTSCTNGQNGITISTGNVSIDLNGFSMVGVPGSKVGIWTGFFYLTNCIVRNGTVTGWGYDGISIGDYGALVFDCSSSGNQSNGISLLQGGIVRDCTTAYNGAAGISVGGGGSTVSGCTVYYNNGPGISAIYSTINNCTANFNHGAGISVANLSLVQGCTADNNQSDGIQVLSDCSVLNNMADGNGGTPGLQGGIHATASGNRIDGNTTFANAGDGILADSNVTACVVVRNTSAFNSGFQYRVPGIPGQPPAGANIVGSVVTDATNVNANAWANFQ